MCLSMLSTAPFCHLVCFYSFHNFLQKMSHGLGGFSGISNTLLFSLGRESSDSVVECLTRDREATASSLTGVTALCPSARHINSSLVLVQPRKTRPYITERLLMGRKESNQTNRSPGSTKHFTTLIV